MTTISPAGTFTPDSIRYSDDGRTVTLRYMRPDMPTFDGKGTRACEVTVRHDKARKRYYVSIGIVDVLPGFVLAHIERQNYMTLHYEDAARFSQKRFDALVEWTQDQLLPYCLSDGYHVAVPLFNGLPMDF